MPPRRTQLAADIAATVTARNADGVNLDFEPMPNSLQSAYTAFVRDVKAALGSRQLTVATTGGAATWDEGYDLAALVAPGAADAIMAMGYDYNWGGSSRAGRSGSDREPVRARRRHGNGRLSRARPGEQAHLGRPLLRPRLDDPVVGDELVDLQVRIGLPGWGCRGGCLRAQLGTALPRRPIVGGDARPPVGRERRRSRGIATRARPTTPGCRATTRMPSLST